MQVDHAERIHFVVDAEKDWRALRGAAEVARRHTPAEFGQRIAVNHEVKLQTLVREESLGVENLHGIVARMSVRLAVEDYPVLTQCASQKMALHEARHRNINNPVVGEAQTVRILGQAADPGADLEDPRQGKARSELTDAPRAVHSIQHALPEDAAIGLEPIVEGIRLGRSNREAERSFEAVQENRQLRYRHLSVWRFRIRQGEYAGRPRQSLEELVAVRGVACPPFRTLVRLDAPDPQILEAVHQVAFVRPTQDVRNGCSVPRTNGLDHGFLHAPDGVPLRVVAIACALVRAQKRFDEPLDEGSIVLDLDPTRHPKGNVRHLGPATMVSPGTGAGRSAAAGPDRAHGTLPSSLEQRTVDDASAGGASERPERGGERRAEPVAQHRLDG